MALALAAFVGDRIGAGLRRLTVTAAAIQGGDLSVRAAIESDDEIGILSSTFDAMADAIEAQTDALRLAAVDETRLRNRLETVVGGMGEALVAVDIEGRVTDFNRAAEELTGVNAASAKGRPATEIVVLTVEDGTDVPARLVHPGPQRWSASATVVQLDGGLVPVAVSAGVLRGADDEVAGNVFVFRDLRGEREIERMKTEFLSRVGHELRTPLTGIIGYSEILTRRDVPPERARVWHGEILAASKRLQRIVEMLEFFASSGAGRVLLRPEPIELRAVVDEVVTRWSAKVDPPTRVTRRVARGVPSIVADRRWLTLSLDELVDNAVKFSPDGGRIQITAAPADASRVPVSGRPGSGARRGAANGEPFPWVEIAVVDRGKGMSIQEQALAFGDFVQGDASDTRAFGGLGLGLSLVKRVVEGHGGMVDCESEPGRGSRFSILLPIVPIPPRK